MNLLAVESVDEIELSELFEFPPFLFENTLLAFNRTALLYLLSALIVTGLMWAAFGNAKIVPGRFQAAMEGVVNFVREGIILETMGPSGLRFLPLFTALFMFIFVNNFYEITPGVQFPTTGRMAVPAMLAVTVYVLFIAVGVRVQGARYFLNAVVPPGVPIAILPLIIPIEIVSTFVVRPVTLAIRLFANMMAGHIILAITFIASNQFLVNVVDGVELFPAGAVGGVLGIILALVAGPALVTFELVVALIQAYIFTILAAVYTASSMSPEH